jgi:hypothetical protein
MERFRKVSCLAAFCISVAYTLVFGITQTRGTMSHPEKSSLSWMACWLSMLLVQLFLAVRARKEDPQDPAKLYTLISVSTWIPMVALDLGACISHPHWKVQDTHILTGVLIWVPCILGYFGFQARSFRSGWANPFCKGWAAAGVTAIPRLVIANGILHGESAIPLATIWAGHITLVMGTYQLAWALRSATCTEPEKLRSVRAALVAQSAAWIAWGVVTWYVLKR